MSSTDPASANPAAHPASFVMDGEDVVFLEGDTIIRAATRAGRYIPHLCWHPDFQAHGSCRVCVVKINGRAAAACTTAAAAGLRIESQTDELNAQRKIILQMLFVEGNHFCPSCEKSGDCLLQATAYELNMEGPRFEQFYPDRPVDASHPEILLDSNRCILCELCVRASNEVDRKGVFAIGGHGIGTRLLINSSNGQLGQTDLAPQDRAAQICPVGAILPKRRGFVIPIGQRRFDSRPVSQMFDNDGEERSR